MQDFNNSIYYYWDGTAVATATDTTVATNPAPTKYQMPTPMNWADTEIKWGRSSTYYGLFRSLGIQFKFIGKAAAILSDIYTTQGIQGVCSLRIQIRDDINDASYNDLYVANIDFSKYAAGWYNDNTPDQSFPNGYVTVQVIDNELFELLNAYGDTQYNIAMINQDASPVVDPDTEYVYTDGTLLTSQFNFISAQGAQPPSHTIAAAIGTPPSVTLSWAVPSMSNIAPQSQYFGNEVMQNNVLIGTQIGDDGSGTTNVWRDQDYVVKCLSLPNTNITGYLTGGVSLTGTYAFGTQFVAALIGVSSDGIARSVQILYQKTINSNSDTSFKLDDPTAGYGITAPTIFYDQANPATITLTSNPGASGVPDGLIYVLGFGMFGVVGSPPHSWQMTFQYPTTAYPYTAFTQDSCNLYMGGGLQYNPSATAAFRYHKIWEKIVPLMTSTQGNYGFPVPAISTPYSGQSNYLSDSTITRAATYDNIPYQTFVTSGNALRDFPNYNYITTSVNDVFNDASRRWSMGIGIEGNVLKLEPLSYFFDGTTQIIDLSDVAITNLTIEPFTQYAGNNINVGYTGQPFNEYGTLDDYNLNLLFRTPITRILNKIDWTCPFNASIYEIEKARADQQANNIQVDPTDTVISDSHQDNAVYLLETQSATTSFDGKSCWLLNRYSWVTTNVKPPATSPSVYGLQYPSTAFNLGLTPKRNLLRNGALLHTICHNLDSNSILFQSASPTGRLLTDTLQSKMDAGLVDEYADVLISTLPTPLFIPILVKFDSPQPTNLWSLLNTNPRGYIKFVWQGITYKGFVWEAGIHPGNDSLFSFQLLLTPDTDLSTLKFLAAA